MERLEKLFLGVCFLLLLLAIVVFASGLIYGHSFNAIFGGGILLLGWCGYKYFQDDKAFWLWGSFLLINLLWWPLFVATILRIKFVIENGGMDRADGYGSPMAFLIGLVGEQIFFIPLTIVLVAGISVIYRSMKSRRKGADTGV